MEQATHIQILCLCGPQAAHQKDSTGLSSRSRPADPEGSQARGRADLEEKYNQVKELDGSCAPSTQTDDCSRYFFRQGRHLRQPVRESAREIFVHLQWRPGWILLKAVRPVGALARERGAHPVLDRRRDEPDGLG